MILAMHMANELLSIPAAAATLVVAAAFVAVAAALARRTLNAERMPLMGVLGAFVFAGQMVNFTLPGMPGTSGHLGGGVLLAIAGLASLAAPPVECQAAIASLSFIGLICSRSRSVFK